MRVLVTGATGFIGRYLVPRLVQEDLSVVIFVEETEFQSRGLPPQINQVRAQIEAVYGDLRNYSVTSRALAEAVPNIVIHLAAAGVTDPFLDINLALRHNLYGTINLLRGSFANNRLTNQPASCIVARTPGELKAMNVYAASKPAAWLFCQMYVQTHHWPIQGAMFFQVYGTGQPPHTLVPAAIRSALAGDDFAMTSGIQARDWIFIDDLVDGLVAMIRSEPEPGSTIEFGTGRPTKVMDVVSQIYEIAGHGGRPLMGVLPDRPGEEALQVADAVKTQDRIGWRSSISLEEGLRRLIEQQKR